MDPRPMPAGHAGYDAPCHDAVLRVGHVAPWESWLQSRCRGHHRGGRCKKREWENAQLYSMTVYEYIYKCRSTGGLVAVGY